MFGQCLENVFCFDKYMKTINVSHNRMSHECIKNLVGPKLRENTSILSLDVRFNQGTTSQLLKQVSLLMLKNIQIHRKKKIPILDGWVSSVVLQHPEIPSKIYEGLNLFSSPSKKAPFDQIDQPINVEKPHILQTLPVNSDEPNQIDFYKVTSKSASRKVISTL